jgi:hypothetical protein
MNEQGNEKWLDEMIFRTINTTKPQFDPEDWKEKYAEEFEILKARAGRKHERIRPSVWKTLLQSTPAKFAAAAAIIAAIALLAVYMGPGEQSYTRPNDQPAQSPAEMLTVMSLKMAYRRGGLEEVERQCDEALKMLGPLPERVTVKQLLAEFNGA